MRFVQIVRCKHCQMLLGYSSEKRVLKEYTNVSVSISTNNCSGNCNYVTISVTV
uniref:Uncharacterized protein n=1 Tax=Jakoba libera TaxID=143017 RepID=M4Q9Z9_JAKLI|nr:hypothetical protein L048_p024 [Jakoba libera]AGH24232.1 hypothetical protein [Jakoba libera]